MTRLAVVLGALAISGRAAAYSDHELYDVAAIEGGGDTRYFTGSKADGYGCSVCHTDGTTEEFSINGLPRTVVPGQRYDLVISWPDRAEPHGLLIELSTSKGHPDVTTIPDAMQPAESRCDELAGNPSAIYVLDRGVRRIVGVEPCGASQIAVGFTAGDEPVEIAIGGVHGNKNDAPTGDRTFERRFVVGDTVEESTGCSTGGGLGWGALVLLGLIGRRRARR